MKSMILLVKIAQKINKWHVRNIVVPFLMFTFCRQIKREKEDDISLEGCKRLKKTMLT